MNTARKGRLGSLFGARVMAAGLLGFLLAPVMGLGLLCLFAYVHADPHDEENPGFLFWTEGLNPGYSPDTGLGNMLHANNDWVFALPFDQFRERVGYVVPLANAPWIQHCAAVPDGASPSGDDKTLTPGVPFAQRPGDTYAVRQWKWMIRVQVNRVVAMTYCNQD